jgi:hypothetical protein
MDERKGADMAFCEKCGTAVPEGAGFCPACGAPTEEARQAQASPDANVRPAGREAASRAAAPPGGRKIKALPIAIAAVALVVVVVAAVFALPRLFGSTAPPIESVGERVEFGTWRDKPITWQVLAIEDGRALLISEDILTVRQYDDLGASSSDEIDWETASTTWAESDIRAWLNDEFLDATFTGEEQEAIDLAPISNPDNSDYGTEGGPDTEDKVFLLSIDEANRYFSDKSDRIANLTVTEEDIQYSLRISKDYWGYDQEELTTYESELRSDYLAQSKAYWWWLRSPGDYGLHAAGVYSDGGVGVAGSNVYHGVGVRPALWLNLKS